MSELNPCSSCNRHVRIADATCPFCAAAMPARAKPSDRVLPLPRPRMSRAAMFAAGATLAGIAACTDTGNNPTEGGAGGAGGAHDGAAAADGASGSGGGGAGGASGSNGGTVPDGAIAIYSAPFPPDAAQD